jgi:hypothetical protein
MERIFAIEAIKNVGNVDFSEINERIKRLEDITSRCSPTPRHIIVSYFNFMGSPN